MSDNSDYTKPRTNLFDLLPEVYQSDTNRSVFENLFNRFLTKQETKRVSGYIGDGNPNAVVKRQIQEFNVHRQAYQLQPILYRKIGSVEWMSSWKDILNEIERQGIDPELIQEWMSLLQFNWVPPVDIDKLIHYRDYYWYDEDNPNSSPQYITIRSRCTTALAYLNFLVEIQAEALNKNAGNPISPYRVAETDDIPGPFDVIEINTTLSHIIVSGDIASDLNIGQLFNITGTSSNDGTYEVQSALTYDNALERTTIPVVPSTLIANETFSGELELIQYDKLIIEGEFARPFEPGFIFYYKNSTNVELNNSFWQVVASEYDETENETIIQINTTFSRDIADGELSMDEQIATASAARDCQCSGSVGWDVFQWDDNPLDPSVWYDQSTGTDHASLLSAISNTGAPTTPGSDKELWWDTDADILYQFTDNTGLWKILWNNFSLVVEQTIGVALWDLAENCASAVETTPSAEQWIEQNKWLHKTDVENYAAAKQAAAPIIEYGWDLEINEWTKTTYSWKYRTENLLPFDPVDVQPEYLEIVPVEYYGLDLGSSREIVIDERYGDLTNYFTPGRQFMITSHSQVFEVESSQFRSPNVGEPGQTRVYVTEDIVTGPEIVFGQPADGVQPAIATVNTTLATTAPIRPVKTSLGDAWKGYNIHWVYINASEKTVPVPHQPANPLTSIDTLTTPPVPHSSGLYDIAFTYYAQESTILTYTPVSAIELTSAPLPSTTRNLRQRALVGTDSIRVYVNGLRQYGTYTEMSSSTKYVTGIMFLTGYEPSQFDVIRIEVGEASPIDFGRAEVEVRNIEDDTLFMAEGPSTVTLVTYRKAEQVKTSTNQYPLFDMYRMDGTPAYDATPLFGYATSPSAPVSSALSRRVIVDDTGTNFTFEQYLVEEDDGVMFAYRDYANRSSDVWVNTSNNTVWFWDGLTWSQSASLGLYYIQAVVSDIPPGIPFTTIEGCYWLDTTTDILKHRDTNTNEWVVTPDVHYANDDPTLQTIWKKGLNDEKYIPQQRDWLKRTEEEYYDEMVLYVEEVAEEILAADGSLTEQEAQGQALAQWLTEQSNHISPSGIWVGDWEIPDPLYFNHNRENRKQISSVELLTHFNTIIEEQPKIPGYGRSKSDMFHLISTNDVNYGLGGKIKEYNYGFDTFLSSMFVNEVSPRTLFEFAQDQYDIMLNNLAELYRKNSVELLTTVSDEALFDLSGFATDAIIDAHEQNDALGLVYGDTTAFIDRPGSDELGVRNWIATLPIFGILNAIQPHKLVDDERGINQVIHHDGHRADYFLADAVLEGIIREVIRAPDYRTVQGPGDEPAPFGIIPEPPELPPNNVDEFETKFDTLIVDRKGVYWYYIDGPDRTLYRLVVQEIGTDAPSSSYGDGTLWLDLTPNFEVLRVKTTDPNTGDIEWAVPQGLTTGQTPIRLHNGTDPSDVTTASVSAWQPINMNDILTDIVLEVERRLFDVVPDYQELRYNFDALRQQYPSLFDQHIEEQFNAYVSEREIVEPYGSTYVATDPFSWNYRYSTIGRPFEIVDVDTTYNAFIISGQFKTTFDQLILGSQPFYIKNADQNNGSWTVASPSVETCVAGPPSSCPSDGWTTTVYVNEPVSDETGGIAYIGTLPSPSNTGAETGGDWRDYYEKLYGTPYPHREPWKLQGYAEKPGWWDEEYLNDNTSKWGERRWKYKHGFDVVDVNVAADTFEIDGDFREVFPTGTTFEIDQSLDHAGTWTVGKMGDVDNVNMGAAGVANLELYDGGNDRTADFPVGLRFSIVSSSNAVVQNLTVSATVFTGPPYNRTVIVVEEAILDDTGFDYFGGATYDAITNRTTIRVDTNTDDVTVAIPSGRIANANGMNGYGMWRNIRLGRIPAGRDYPNGVTSVTGSPADDRVYHGLVVPDLRTYRYMSVNVDNTTIATGGTYAPDDVFAPYWDFVAHFGTANVPTFDAPIRSLFSHKTTEIRAESANYVFGDAGPVEWEWRSSSQFLYDLLTVAFRIDPIRLFHDVFGPEYHTIAGLFVDQLKERTFAHGITDFHGDVVGTSDIVEYNGTNQWYINYLRRAGIDLSMSDFRTSWTDWTAPMTYQFSSFIDTPSLSVAHRQVCISEFDYRVASKRSVGVEDYWADSFDVYTLSVPPRIARYDNENAWRFEVHTKPPYGRDINYYDVHHYQFYADPTTDIMTIYSWAVADMNFFNDTFSVRGNQTDLFISGRSFDIVDSTDNDGTYTVESSVYDLVADETLINVEENVFGLTVDGRIVLDYREVPWEAGEAVVLTTTETLPIPLNGENVNGVYLYYIVRVLDVNDDPIPNQFRLATTKQAALQGSYVDVTTVGRGDHHVGQIYTTFDVPDIPTYWKNYVIDKTNLLTFTAPNEVTGIQSMINIINGYWQYQEDQGWRYNEDNSLRDPTDTSYAVSWQQELRRFIKFIHQVRTSNTKVENRYPSTVDVSTNTWTITDSSTPFYVTGDPVTIHSSNRIYPPPLVHGGRYYIIRDDISTFRLAATKADARDGNEIDILSDVAVGDMFLMDAAVLTKTAPKFELNPFRNALWFRPARGIVSNLLGASGTVDTFSSPIMADQYGRPLGRNDIRIFREDKQTKMTVESLISNDVELTRIFRDPYNFIHLGVAHVFVDTYEHVLMFNNNTTEGALLYDPFIGLNVTKFEMLFNRQIEFTQRPNVGGQYYITENNQGAELKRNIEASIEDLRNLYDTYRVIEANNYVQQSRKTLGYEGTTDYLDNLNLSAKSQFSFWRGQIQHKGAVTSIQAFVNSRRFIDAKVDEYWAVKIPGGEFGSRLDKEFLEMWLYAEDAQNNEFRLQFIDNDNICDAGYGIGNFDNQCGYAFPNEGDAVTIFDEGWTPIEITDQERWVNEPDQLIKLINNGGSMYFDLRLVPSMKTKIADLPSRDVVDQYVRHNFKADYVVITGTLAGAPEFHDAPPGAISVDGHSVTIPDYIPGAGMLTVFIADESSCASDSTAYEAIAGCAIAGDGTTLVDDGAVTGPKAVQNIDYEEIATGNFTSTEIRFANDVTGKTIRIVYGPATLVPDVHYSHYTSNITKVEFDEIIDGTLEDATVWGMLFDHTALDPHKIIDTASETVITPVQYWDPARGIHYYNAIHIVDLQITTDPAFYSYTPETDMAQRRRIADDNAIVRASRTAEETWRSSKVGTTWLDTNQLDYVPYYDPNAYDPSGNDEGLDDRLLLWGELADWSDLRIRTWIESDVPPEEWNSSEATEYGIDPTTGEFKANYVERVRFENIGTVVDPEWVVARNKYEDFDVVVEGTEQSDGVYFTLPMNSKITDLEINENIELFVNGKWLPRILLEEEQWVVTSPDTFKVIGLGETDRVRLVQFVPGQRPASIDEDGTNASLEAAAISNGMLMLDYQYVERIYFDRFGLERSKYYFWVTNRPVRDDRVMSPVNAQDYMRTIPIPYAMYTDIAPPKTIEFEDFTTNVPWRFTKAIIRGIRNIVDSDRRYALRWLRDHTLRDTLETGRTPLEKKNLHVQWDLIRPEMPQTIPRWLWDKITESIIGFTLSNSYEIENTRVPSLSRELYDETYNAETQYGLGVGQAFTDGDLALNTILTYLNDPNVDFSPVDVNVFFQNHEFDQNDPETIVDAMNSIYNTFPYIHVNKMFFECLLDAFSKKRKYEDIFKTSMIALHGIRPFQVGGLFDD